MKNSKNIKAIKTVSEYIALGGLAIAVLVDSPVRETEKALAFSAVRTNSCGNEYLGVAWLPKSQLVEVENDFYTNDAPSKMYICPTWLYEKSFPEGTIIS